MQHSINNKKLLPTTINISLKEERATLDFNQEALSELTWGGKESLQRFRTLMELFSTDPILKNTHFFYEMTREEKMELNYQRMPQLYKKIPEDLTYKNIFDYVLIAGSVRTLLMLNKSIIDPYYIASRDV